MGIDAGRRQKNTSPVKKFMRSPRLAPSIKGDWNEVGILRTFGGHDPMAGASMTAALQQVSRLFREGTLNTLPDDRLLDRFLDQGDEDAFAALIGRHGPM